MKNCKDCKFAEWRRTAAGRLHPSGDGKCTFQWTMPPLPSAFYWLGAQRPMGGWINRKRDFSDHCPYYQRASIEAKGSTP